MPKKKPDQEATKFVPTFTFLPRFPHRPGEHGMPEDGSVPRIEAICGGVDNSQPVEQYNGTLGVTTAFVNAHQARVGNLQWNSNLAAIYNSAGNVSGVRWCTGTLISNNLLLTAGHCFDQMPDDWTLPLINGTTNIIPPTEIARNMHVNFNYQDDPNGNPRPEQEFAILELLEYRLNGLDYAIVRLAGNPGATFGFTTISPNDASVGNMLCLIQHPQGVPKRIEAGPLTEFQGNFVRYNDIDTLGGSSGSGILLSPTGTIVGVHTNGGCDNVAFGHNHGVRIASIIAASPIITNMLFPTCS